jgi:hypothetical protein
LVDEAKQYAEDAEDSADSASASASSASASASASASSANSASASASSASASANTATTQAGIATTQAGIATTQAGIATTKANEASQSASDALASEQASAQSASNALQSEQNALASEQASAQSEANALASEQSASASASTATAQAGIATTQAGIATAAAASIVPVTIGTPANGLSIDSNQVLSIGLASGSANGALSSTDWSTFNAKQPAIGYTPENVANKAINLTSPDDTKYPTTLAVSTALAGKQNTLTNPITGTGASGQVAFWSGTGTQTGSNNLFWDNVNGRLGIGTNAPTTNLDIRVSGAGGSASNASNSIIISAATITDITEGEIGSQIILNARRNGVSDGVSIASVMSTANFDLASMAFYTHPNSSGTPRVECMRLFGSTGNLLIQNGGTFTDAGFRLDVNGTARVQGRTDIAAGIDATTSVLMSLRNPFTSTNTGVTLRFSNSTAVDVPQGQAEITALRTNSGASGATDLIFRTSVGGSVTEKWKITSTGIFQSNGAQTIQTSTGLLSLQSNAGNVGINTTTDAGFRLDVNGTARVQGALTTNLTAGSVPFIGASGLLTQDNTNLFWDNTLKRLKVGSNNSSIYTTGVLTNQMFQLINRDTTDNTSMSLTFRSVDTNNVEFGAAGITGIITSHNPITAAGILAFSTNNNNVFEERWRITSTGILQSNGAQTIQTSTGNLTIATNGGNGNIILNPNGSGTVSITDAKNIALGTTTGTKIGTATSQKLALWNATPIVQPTTAVAGATRVGGGGTTLTDTDTFDGYTLAQIVKALRNIGALA